MGLCCSSNKDNKGTKTTGKIENAKKVNSSYKLNAEPIQEEVKISKPQLNITQTIKIRFYYDGKPIELEPLEVRETESLDSILDPIKNNLPLLSDYSFQDKENRVISPKDSLEKIFKKDDKYEDTVQVINVVYEGLDIPATRDQIISSYAKTYLIGNPVAQSCPFELRIFDTKSMELTNITFNVEDHAELITFSHFSAYCNGNNFLYLSGGETEVKDPNTGTSSTKILNWISKINLDNGRRTQLEPMKYPRTWHSMIYIPNKYVFIVGGKTTTSVEVLNTETGEISEDSNLNEFHCEPSLCLVNQNYLYCFLGYKSDFNSDFNSDYSYTIERCNLRLKQRSWELVNVTYPNGETSIKSSLLTRFFSVCYYNQDNILLLGGDNINNKDISQIDIVDNENVSENAKKTGDESQFKVKDDRVRSPAYVFNFITNSITELDISNKKFFKQLKEKSDEEVDRNEVNEANIQIKNFNELGREVFPEKFFVPTCNSNNDKIYCLMPMQTHKLKIYLKNPDSFMEVREFEDDDMTIDEPQNLA